MDTGALGCTTHSPPRRSGFECGASHVRVVSQSSCDHARGLSNCEAFCPVDCISPESRSGEWAVSESYEPFSGRTRTEDGLLWTQKSLLEVVTCTTMFGTAEHSEKSQRLVALRQKHLRFEERSSSWPGMPEYKLWSPTSNRSAVLQLRATLRRSPSCRLHRRNPDPL